MSETMGFVVVMLGFLAVGIATWIWTGRRRRPLAADPSIDWPPGWTDGRASSLARPGAVLVALLVAGAVFGGGWYALQPSWQEVYDRYVDRIDAMERRFDRIAASLPAPGRVRYDSSRIELDPPPVYDLRRGLVNIEFVSEEDLINPLNRSYGDLFLSGALSRYVYWRHSPPYTADEKAEGGMAESIEAALAYRYLVVIRTLGETDYEAYLFDLSSTELLFALRFSAGTRSDAASRLLRELRTRTNGTFVGGG